ncbi:DUF4430 domain-containing protein [Neobacillus notoginsengisoli]|uniref:DUF4430 domain-containing protein n=1 Tax=Neobacillus notoginsengisoli TaxID=1578198 RepID=A0A417YXV7_9BACI|nr:DUF4430 domain-containing protein [Neobacillus notoginsengisoli]RHW42576.1 DUF4430 domain-containing protein [Neobacillus notoginsengisoli]
MNRKILLRLLLVFSLLAAFALAGCGTAPESKKNAAEQGQHDIALDHENGQDEDGASDSIAGDGEGEADPDTSFSNEAPASGSSKDPGDSDAKKKVEQPASSTPSSPPADKPKAGTASGGAAGSGNGTSSNSSGSSKGSGAASASAGSAGTGSATSGATSKPSQPAAKPAPKPVSKPSPKPESAATATISIKGPKDVGTILGATAVEVKEGDTVLNVLLRATGKKIHVEHRGSGATAYVEGIDNYYEFDYGAKSGWTCKKNGTTIDRSAGLVKVAKGDRIEWIYIEG